MKFVLTLLALSTIVITSCERHKFEDVKVMHESHGSAHDESHGGEEHAEHGEHKEAH
jgi:hypothetical protein